jgi:predicted RNase H-like nuclease
MRFVGIDLAWSDRHPTGFAVLEGGPRRVRLLEAGLLQTDAEIIAGVMRHADGPLQVAIDAPLVVPNPAGTRPGDRQVASLFGKYRAGPHPANRTVLARRHGRIRGEDLAAMLEKEGLAHDPSPGRGSPRRFFEVYPHPAIVALLGLEERLRYKSGWPRATRLRAFRELAEGLAGLRQPQIDFGGEGFRVGAAGLRGVALKSYEDRLDAIVCAYVAARYWSRPQDCACLGTREAGYIVTPLLPGMLAA